jgi:uncharacterized protein (DUF2147 family)
MKILFLATLSLVVLITSSETGAASPIGDWVDSDGTTIRISRCGQNLCGFIAQMNPQNDPETHRPWVDKNNVDPEKRNRPRVGIEILISMESKSPGKWSGQLYNVDDGKIYSGNLIERDQSTVRIEGCVLGICGGDNLTRLK